jgi:hypothetical protein
MRRLSEIWLFDGSFVRLSEHKTADCLALEEIQIKATAPVIGFLLVRRKKHTRTVCLSGCLGKIKKSGDTENFSMFGMIFRIGKKII